MPTADRTMSASTVSSPFFVLMMTEHFSPVVSTESTSLLVITLMPAFLNERSSCFDTSSSSNGTMLGRNSTSVTFVPMAL